MTSLVRDTFQQRKKTICVNLQPLKRNFDRIDTERVYRVIEDVDEKVSETQFLFEIIADDAKIFSIRDKELRDCLLKHQHWIEESNIEAIKASLKNIFKYCTRNGIMLSSYSGKNLDSMKTSLFSKYISKLCKILHERLLTESEEENARSKYLLQLMEKSRHFQSTINSSSEVLKTKVKEKEHRLNEKDRVIRQMKHDLDAVVSTTGEENKVILIDAAKKILTEQRALENKESKIVQEIIDLKTKVNKQRITHYAAESKLRKRKSKMSGELHNWILKYDSDMGWRQEQIEELTRLNEQDIEGTKELEKHFDIVEKEYNIVMEEKREKSEMEMLINKEKRQKNRAAIKIQALWRGFDTRMKLSGKINKKGKKDKMKGKGKK